jgi:phage-related minor tail protein
MAQKQSDQQKETIERVMHEYKHGELKIRGSGPKVKSRKQAIAIALHESGSTNQESPRKNKQNLKRTKQKERRGETAQAETEGKKAQDRTMKSATAGEGKSDRSENSKSALYEQARKRDIPGRSKMSKSELERALRR